MLLELAVGAGNLGLGWVILADGGESRGYFSSTSFAVCFAAIALNDWESIS